MVVLVKKIWFLWWKTGCCGKKIVVLVIKWVVFVKCGSCDKKGCCKKSLKTVSVIKSCGKEVVVVKMFLWKESCWCGKKKLW